MGPLIKYQDHKVYIGCNLVILFHIISLNCITWHLDFLLGDIIDMLCIGYDLIHWDYCVTSIGFVIFIFSILAWIASLAW